MNEQWICFHGRAIDNGTAWVLESEDGEGAVAAAKDDVRFDGDSVSLCRGAPVKVLRAPPAGGRPASIAYSAGECPGGRTMCIGFVVICCANSCVIGEGLGYWNDCP